MLQQNTLLPDHSHRETSPGLAHTFRSPDHFLHSGRTDRLRASARDRPSTARAVSGLPVDNNLPVQPRIDLLFYSPIIWQCVITDPVSRSPLSDARIVSLRDSRRSASPQFDYH